MRMNDLNEEKLTPTEEKAWNKWFYSGNNAPETDVENEARKMQRMDVPKKLISKYLV